MQAQPHYPGLRASRSFRRMIELDEVTKSYRTGALGMGGRIRALDGVTLQIEPGTACGIIGLNGAGKSTLLRLLMGYLRPTTGRVLIEGVAPRSYVQRTGVAYVAERISIPRGWTVRGALRAYAMLGNLGEDAFDRVELAIERLGLSPLAERKVGALSKGNLQRLGIAQAILADRRLMILDEPTDGLDPVWIFELRQILSDWMADDPTRVLLLTSHNLHEVERLSNRVVLLHNGRIAGELTPGKDGVDLEEAFLARVHALEEGRP